MGALTLVAVDIDAELGTFAEWSVSPRDARTGAEGAERQAIPPPTCYLPQVAWKIRGELWTDGLFLWRDGVLNAVADWAGQETVCVRDGTLTVLDLAVVHGI